MMYIIISLILALVFAGMLTRRGEDLTISIIGAVICFLFFGAINYFAMPVLAWGYWGLLFELFLVVIVAAFISSAFDEEWNWQCWVATCYTIFMIILGLSSSEMFNSRSYQQMMNVEDVEFNNFAEDVNIIPVEKMVVADYDLARKVVEDRLEEDPGLGSRCFVGNMTMQNLTGSFTINDGIELTFNNDLVWVAPLEHTGFFKWVSNDYTPGYMLVYANDPTKTYLITKVNGKDLKLRYLETGCFGDDIERHIRTNGYASQGLTEHNFEIDFNGQPHWVLCNYEPTIGYSGGCDSKGVITVNIQTGEINQYAMDEAPEWVDHIQPEWFVSEQIRCWGEYKLGYWNAVFAEIDVQVPTPGMVLVYSNGQSYWYTGIQSAGGDSATSGFVLVNARTKEAKYYRVSGVNELEAKSIAEDQNFAKAASYYATSPVLYNVRGIPTYFMTLKGSSGNVTGYAFVAVTNRQAVGVGSSKREAETNYLQSLRRTTNDAITDGPVVTVDVKTFTVRDITLEGNVYYILFNEVKGKEFTGSSEFFRELKWTKPNNRVNVSYSEGSSNVILLDSFDNLDFEF